MARDFELFSEIVSQPAESSARKAALHWQTFSLSTLFLWTTLVALIMGLSRLDVVSAITAAAASIPAAIRTIAIARSHERLGHPMSAVEKILSFVAAIAIAPLLFILTYAGLCVLVPILFALYLGFEVLCQTLQSFTAHLSPIAQVVMVSFVAAGIAIVVVRTVGPWLWRTLWSIGKVIGNLWIIYFSGGTF